MSTASFPRLRILHALVALAVLMPPNVAGAQTRPVAAIFAQLTISPAQPSTVPAQLPPAPAPRPAPTQRPATQRPAPRPVRPPAAPARPTPAAAPAVAPAPAAADQAKEEREQLLKQVGDLRSEVAYLNVQAGNLTAQVSGLTGTVSDLQKQLADAEQRLKNEIGRAAGPPVQAGSPAGAVDTASDPPVIARFLRSSWSDIAVPATLFLLLCALLGTMVVGVPVRALMYRVPRREPADAGSQRRSIPNREGIAARVDPR